MYIVFEGGEGSGKSSASTGAFDRLRSEFPSREFRWTREPGGVVWAERVRELLFSPLSDEHIDVEEEILLFAVARVNLLRNIPRLVNEEKAVVLSDRNVWSSLAYQASMAPQHADLIYDINTKLNGDRLIPDLVIFFDVPAALGLERASWRKAGNNRNDVRPLEWHEGVHKRYAELVANKTLAKEVVVVDATKPQAEVLEEVMAIIKARI